MILHISFSSYHYTHTCLLLFSVLGLLISGLVNLFIFLAISKNGGPIFWSRSTLWHLEACLLGVSNLALWLPVAVALPHLTLAVMPLASATEAAPEAHENSLGRGSMLVAMANAAALLWWLSAVLAAICSLLVVEEVTTALARLGVVAVRTLRIPAAAM